MSSKKLHELGFEKACRLAACSDPRARLQTRSAHACERQAHLHELHAIMTLHFPHLVGPTPLMLVSSSSRVAGFIQCQVAPLASAWIAAKVFKLLELNADLMLAWHQAALRSARRASEFRPAHARLDYSLRRVRSWHREQGNGRRARSVAARQDLEARAAICGGSCALGGRSGGRDGLAAASRASAVPCGLQSTRLAYLPHDRRRFMAAGLLWPPKSQMAVARRVWLFWAAPPPISSGD